MMNLRFLSDLINPRTCTLKENLDTKAFTTLCASAKLEVHWPNTNDLLAQLPKCR